MRLKDNTNPFIHVNPPYQLMVIHSSKLVYPRELYQRGVERKRVELIAAHFNEYVANEPKVSFRNGQFIVTDGQHTIEGRILRNGGKDLPILCKVYTGMTVEQEALLFAEQNGFSAPLTAGIKLRAKVVGGDAISKAFLAATNRVGWQTGFVPGLCSERHDAFCGAVPRRVQRRTAAPCAAQHPPGRYLPHRAGRPRKAARMEKIRFSHLHHLQRQVQKRRTADEILIFTGIPPIYTRGIRKPQMPLVTYQSAIYSVSVFILYNI